MCAPDHFGVAYKINPWMDPNSWVAQRSRAHRGGAREWAALHRTLLGARRRDRSRAAGARRARSGLHRQRRRRDGPCRAAGTLPLSASGNARRRISKPRSDRCRGEGPDRCGADAAGRSRPRRRRRLRVGRDARPLLDRDTVRAPSRRAEAVEDMFGVATIALELADPRFYHMDTALCPLPGGEIMYVPGAFTPQGQADIRDRVKPGAAHRGRHRGRMPARRQRRLHREYARDVGMQRAPALQRSRSEATASRLIRCIRSCAAAARPSA